MTGGSWNTDPLPPPSPAGAGLSKGDTSHKWSHGWGDPLTSFWCCYGSAVESFAKLADSIYFHRSPAAPADGLAPATAPPPELWVNQLVSSTLRWREAGVALTLEADLYPEGDNIVTATLVVRTTRRQEQRQGGGDGGGGGGDEDGGGGDGSRRRRFLLHWRVPSWADAAGLRVAVNGVENAACAAAARERSASGSQEGTLGEGAGYCTLGPDWRDGDVGEPAGAALTRSFLGSCLPAQPHTAASQR